MNLVLKKMEAIAKVNEEIIQRILGQPSVDVLCYQIVQQKKRLTTMPQFIVKETKLNKNVSDITRKWKCQAKFQVIEDTFNDKLKYECTTFEDVTSLKKSIYASSSPKV